MCDVQNNSKYNDNFKYILTAIDIFSRYAWAVAIKRKFGSHIIEAFESIFKLAKRIPLSLQTDRGGEFMNKAFQNI